jgi:hypothetical protein
MASSQSGGRLAGKNAIITGAGGYVSAPSLSTSLGMTCRDRH